jgi:Ran GTPase-activating protein (RanGAP) involved in mRNA processing and transport
MAVLGPALTVLQAMSELDLSENERISEEGIIHLSAGLQDLKQLRVLKLANISMHDKGLIALAAALATQSCDGALDSKSQTGLLHLDINENRYITGKAITELLKQVPSITTLRTTVWADRELVAEAKVCATGSDSVLFYAPSLTTLILEGMSIKSDNIPALSNSLRSIPSLTELNLSRTRSLVGKGMDVLAQTGLKHLPRLKVMRLCFNDMSDENVAGLARVLRYLPDLIDLDLEGNDIGVLAAKSISSHLRHTPRLRMLNLSRKKGEDSKLVHFYSNQKHGDIYISYQRPRQGGMGNDGCEAIAASLPRLPELRVLCLRAQAIGNIGAIALARKLSCLGNLEVLEIDDNNIDDLGIAALAPVCFSLPMLTRVNFEANTFHAQGAALLAASLARYTRTPLNQHRDGMQTLLGCGFCPGTMSVIIGSFIGLIHSSDWQEYLHEILLCKLPAGSRVRLGSCYTIRTTRDDCRTYREVRAQAEQETLHLTKVCLEAWMHEFAWQRRKLLIVGWCRGIGRRELAKPVNKPWHRFSIYVRRWLALGGRKGESRLF